MQDTTCPQCGAVWANGQTCTDYFNLMGFWELDYQLYEVHHLMVLCYHLQHPGLYSPEGLNKAIRLLVDFVDRGLTPETIRKRDSGSLDSGARMYKIKGTDQLHAAYPQTVHWSMTAADVTAGGLEHYYDNVRAWAHSVLETLRETANLAVS